MKRYQCYLDDLYETDLVESPDKDIVGIVVEYGDYAVLAEHSGRLIEKVQELIDAINLSPETVTKASDLLNKPTTD